MVHLYEGKEGFIAMTTGVCVNDGNLLITYTWRKYVLVRYSLVYLLAPCIDGWYISTGKVVLCVVIVVANGKSSVRSYMIAAKAEIRVYIFSFRCSKYCECHIPCSYVFWCISFACRRTRYKHLVSFGALVA